MTAELINKYISHFKTIWLNGEEINPIPKNAKVTVWCDNGEDEKGFMKNVDGDKMGLNAFIAQSWIEHSELLNLILEDETRTKN